MRLAFSLYFHPSLVSNVNLYKGSMPSKYGGRLSSVLNVGTKTGDKQSWHLNGGIGMVSSTLAIEGPLVKDKTSVILGARISYSDWFLKQINLPDVQKSHVSFHDLQGTIDHRLSEKSRIGFQAYTGYDNVRFADEAQFEYNTNAFSVYYKSIIGSKLNLSLRATHGDYDTGLDDLDLNNARILETGIRYNKMNVDFVLQSGKESQINFGVGGYSL